jgi:hypothetical protein
MNRKLVYEEPIRFANNGSNQQKSDQQFDMTCSCGKVFSVPVDIVGNSAPCPKCGNYVTISNEEFMPFTCGCGKTLRIPRAGSTKKCPACKQLVKLLIALSAPAQPEKSPCEKVVVIDSEKITQSEEKTDSETSHAIKEVKSTYVKVKCRCGEKFSLPATKAHHSIECPQCHNKFKLPEKHFIHVNCPCGAEFKVLRMLEGKEFKCPKCGQKQKAVEGLNLNLAS